ncbi:MAG: acyl-CoA thioesterase [Gammaproteobacteria bacterium]|nr:MAG: acyl-CoA thioesterase [Deltaproteobacteria bacterium]PIE48150.1 MAG: acyl-CoA thioesterase [Gammaproteobacteria bacterium]
MKSKKVEESKVIISQLMQPEHANPGGIIHGGVVMKEIDNAAGAVAVKHGRKIAVTASIDRISFHHMIFIGNLVSIKASINKAWKSSMEIGVRVEAEDLLKGETRHVASAYLTFVALDENGKPSEIPQLELVTEDEKRRAKEAENRKKIRLEVKETEKACQDGSFKCNIS